MTEPALLKAVLLRQFDLAWALAAHHLDGLTTEDCLWRPAARGLHVRRDETGAWRADWPEHERYDLGPPSIAWTTWHMIFWWSAALDQAFGAAGPVARDTPWPGDAEAVVARLAELRDRWREAVGALGPDELSSHARTRWPFTGRPFADVVAWANVELAKNAAEIGQARFLRAIRDEA